MIQFDFFIFLYVTKYKTQGDTKTAKTPCWSLKKFHSLKLILASSKPKLKNDIL